MSEEKQEQQKKVLLQLEFDTEDQVLSFFFFFELRFLLFNSFLKFLFIQQPYIAQA